MFALRYKKLGIKIAYYRKLKGLTQIELASKVGISASHLSKIERGVAQGVPMSIYWNIADVLCVNLKNILDD